MSFNLNNSKCYYICSNYFIEKYYSFSYAGAVIELKNVHINIYHIHQYKKEADNMNILQPMKPLTVFKSAFFF